MRIKQLLCLNSYKPLKKRFKKKISKNIVIKDAMIVSLEHLGI